MISKNRLNHNILISTTYYQLQQPQHSILKSYTLKLFLLVSIAIISACDTQPMKPGQDVIEESRPVTEKQVTLIQEAEKLIELAEDSESENKQLEYRTQAARLYIEANNLELAKQQLAVIKSQVGYRDFSDSVTTAPVIGENVISKQALAAITLISAELAIVEKYAALAGEYINSAKPVTREQQIYFYELKADLDFLTGKYMYAVDRRVQLDAYITDEKHKTRNNRKIWAALSNLPNTQLNKQSSNNATILGWLDLAKVMRSGQQQISQLENELLDWGTRHPAHPVNNSFLIELINNYQSILSDKKQIAILLPLEGKLSKVTDTIKNGILSAYYNDANLPTKPVIRFYDSSNEKLSFQQIMQQAIDDGATNIVGPVDKTIISQLTQQRELDIPVLTLNYSENSLNNTYNLFQFGLSPEDEARQVAELAIHQNKMRAAVFYPDSEWGQRLNNAFTAHFQLLGGKVLSAKNYATTTNDYSRSIRTLLNLDQSDIRRRKVENTISTKAQSESYRRQDIDMIFLAATHQSARGIMPAFKFHHAGDLPVYSTSHVYTGKVNYDLDRDLNGLIYCDLPWVLQNNSPLLNTFNQNWPQQQNYTRLFALGVDAYHLVYNLDYLQNRDYAVYDGQTGNIRLDENNRVTRKLLWAKFINGRPVYFEPVNTDAETAEDGS